MFLWGMEACLAEELDKQSQELLETTWEQLKGRSVQGLFVSKFGYSFFKLLWLSTRKTKRNPDLCLPRDPVIP